MKKKNCIFKLVIILGSFFIGFWNCSTSIVGGGSESGNPIIIGQVVTIENTPVANAQVYLLPATYNPGADQPLPDSLIDTTDNNGYYNFPIPDTAIFNIQVSTANYEKRALRKGISTISAKDTIKVENLSLTNVGVVKIYLPDTVDTVNGYLYIEGTTITTGLAGNVENINEGYQIILGAIPGANPLTLFYAEHNNPQMPTAICDTFQVMAKDTTLINAFLFWKTYTKENESLYDNRVTDIFIANHNDFWFATLSGAARFDGIDWDLGFITDYTGLPSNNINQISQDRDGNIWFATDRGIARYNGGVPHEPANWEIHNIQISGLPANYISDIVVDYQGNLWVGMWDGIGVYNPVDKWRFYDRSNSDLVSYKIHEITIDQDGIIWFATDNKIAALNLRDTSWSIFETSNSSITTDVVTAVACDQHNNKWFGYDGGVSKLDVNDSTWTGYTANDSKMLYNRVVDIYVEDENNIWFGTTNGLTRFDGNKWYDYVGEIYHPLENKGVNSIKIDQHGNKWIATINDGIIVFGPSAKS